MAKTEYLVLRTIEGALHPIGCMAATSAKQAIRVRAATLPRAEPDEAGTEVITLHAVPVRNWTRVEVQTAQPEPVTKYIEIPGVPVPAPPSAVAVEEDGA